MKFRVGITTRLLSGLPQGFDSKLRIRVSEFGFAGLPWTLKNLLFLGFQKVQRFFRV